MIPPHSAEAAAKHRAHQQSESNRPSRFVSRATSAMLWGQSQIAWGVGMAHAIWNILFAVVVLQTLSSLPFEASASERKEHRKERKIHIMRLAVPVAINTSTYCSHKHCCDELGQRCRFFRINGCRGFSSVLFYFFLVTASLGVPRFALFWSLASLG